MENLVCGLCVFFVSIFGSLKYGRCEKKGLSTEYLRTACSDCKARRTMPRTEDQVKGDCLAFHKTNNNLNSPGKWDWAEHGEASDGFSNFVSTGSENAPGNQTQLSRMQVEMSCNNENTVIFQEKTGKGGSWKPDGDVEFFCSQIFGNVFPVYEGYKGNFKKLFLSETLRNIEKYHIETRRHLAMIVQQISEIEFLARDFGLLTVTNEKSTSEMLMEIYNDLMPEKKPVKGSEKIDLFICRLNKQAENIPRMDAGKRRFEAPERDEAWKTDYTAFQYKKLEEGIEETPNFNKGPAGKPYRPNWTMEW